MLEKTLESPLDCKGIQPVHPKGDWSWVVTGGTDVEQLEKTYETPQSLGDEGTQRSLRCGLLSPYSAAPAGAQTFSLKHSEHVRVEVVHDGQAEEVATNGKQRWPLSPSTTLRLTMSQASPEASSDKVPWAGQRSCAGLGEEVFGPSSVHTLKIAVCSYSVRVGEESLQS